MSKLRIRGHNYLNTLISVPSNSIYLKNIEAPSAIQYLICESRSTPGVREKIKKV